MQQKNFSKYSSVTTSSAAEEFNKKKNWVQGGFKDKYSMIYYSKKITSNCTLNQFLKSLSIFELELEQSTRKE
jgi:hypothetical protein